ncbi:MAG TPA: sulfatase-like hydrolase/transferase [Vicinamibacterales bacterium]|nr:sulfatase-like hydrolase/transferase [Vicinamibacterales bacterium]
MSARREPRGPRREARGARRAAWIAITLVIVLGVAWALWRATRPPAPGPIVLISIDTLRADHLPAYGYTKVRTPNIDTLAAEGVVFEHAWSHAPQTLPAHTSLLSGQLPFEHGVRDNVGFTVKKGQWFIQRALQERGWPTGGFVSAYVLRAATGINQGFDTYDSDMPASSGERSIGQVQRGGDKTLAAAISWIDARDRAKPFFLFLHFYEPHKPYAPPARFAAYSPYDGEIAYSDELVGRFLDRLRSAGLYDRATIVLLADHGEGLGDHGEQEHGLFLYQETTRVPLIVKLPGRHRGRRVAAPVQHIDLAPTILDLAGAPARTELRGRSLRPLLEGTGALQDAPIYSEALYSRYHFGWSELYGLVDSRYHFIRAPRDELYDLERDRSESQSIGADRPQVRQAMRGALESMIAKTSIAAPAAVDEQDRQRLAALGYVGTGSSASLSLPGDSLPDPKDKIQVLEKYRRASDLAGALKFADAMVLYRELLAADPEMTDAWLQLAEVCLRQGLTEDGVRAYREVIKRNPKDAGSLLGAGGGLLRLGRLDEAQKHAELAVSVAPAAAHELLAKIALARHDPDAALREARLAQQADPTLPMPLFVEGLIAYNQGRYAEALGPFMRARDALRGRTIQINELNYYLGDSLAHLERYPEAEPCFQEEIRLFPHNTRARAGLAMLYRAMGRDADSERAIDDLLRASPTPEGRALAAQLWTMFGEPEKARQVKIR